MGVPKFFRWLSERYPLITIPIEPSFTPEFDNLYLDMNGIIHNCTHPEWNDNVLNQLSEKEMIILIFHYIDKLFHAVKPQKLIYLAIDGVAPRAKMNQQRQRRLRTAQEAKEALEKAAETGEKTKEPRTMFDSNCITPGTEFMAKLSNYLKYFIRKKIREDSAWKKVKVILSGHEVPGEGEHKIMEYIRRQKMLPDHDPNTRHCLYGLDADLIMLALVSHEPHFALLREEVTFGRRKKKNDATPPKFQLLFVNLLREYLDEEFRTELPFGYELERVIDDFILFCFFVGNDFLPNLPYMDIADGALDKMFEIYKELLPTLGGYITERGEINWERCEKFLKQIAQYEQDMLSTMPPLHLEVLEQSLQADSEEEAEEEEIEDRSKFNAWQLKMKEKQNTLRASGDKHSAANEDSGTANEVADALAELDEETVVFEGGLRTKNDSESDFGAMAAASEKFNEQRNRARDEEEEEELYDDDSWKNWYYRDKFRVGLENEEYHKHLRRSYLEGLVWVLRYYYRGCCSWNWFFPFHYAPLCSDLVNLTTYDLKFDLGKPFLPFQQLMGVLPVASKTLLPVPYQELMTRADSPILDFYPEEFKVDMNGKRNAWEAIALIPFIDEKRLLSAMETVDKSRLTENERRRDSFGTAFLFQFDHNDQTLFPTPMPGVFADLFPCQVSQSEFHLAEWGPEGQITPYLLPGAKFGLQNQPGFPTLQNLRHTSHLAYAGLSVFGTSSRKQSLLLKVLPPEGKEAKDKITELGASSETEAAPSAILTKEQPVDDVDASKVQHLLGQMVYVEWPYLKEARVLGISDGDCRTSQAQGTVQHTMGDAGAWHKESKYQKNHYKAKKGMDIGEVKVMLHVQVLRGMKTRKDGSRIKLWRTVDDIYPLQTIVKEHYAPDPRLQEREAPSVEEAFPIGQRVVYVGPGPNFGGLGTVVEHLPTPEGDPANVRVEIDVPPPPASFGRRIALQNQENFYHLSEVSRRLGISPKVLSKITASVYAQHQNRKINIGLRIKFTRKGQQMLGYTQRIETPAPNGISRGYWMYSAKALDLVYQFMDKFPDLFQALEAEEAQEIEVFSPEMLFPNGNASERMAEVEEWLKHLPTNNLERVPIGSKAMSKDAVKTVEEESNRYMAVINARKKKTASVACPIIHLMTPLPDIPTDEEELGHTDIGLGERVMNLRDNGPIPFGLTGTVTGIVGNLLEIVFDEEFLGGSDLGGRCSDLRGQQHISPSTVLNLGPGPSPKRGGRNSGPQQNAWSRPERDQQSYASGGAPGPRGPHHQQPQGGHPYQQQHQQQQTYGQPAQQQPRSNHRGGQGAGDKPVAILSRSGEGQQGRRDMKRSGDNKAMYRPKQSGADEAATGAGGDVPASGAAPAGGRRDRSRKGSPKQASPAVPSAAGTNGHPSGSTESEVAEYWNKLQSQGGESTADGEAGGAPSKPRRERRRGGGKRGGNQHGGAAQAEQPLTVPSPAGPLLPGQAAAPYPVYYYPTAPNFAPQPYMMPAQYGAVPPAALYGPHGVAAMPLAAAPGATATIPIPGLPVPLQVPLTPGAVPAAPLNWQQQEVGDGAPKKAPRARGGRGRGRNARGGAPAGGDQAGQAQAPHQQASQPRKLRNSAGGEDASGGAGPQAPGQQPRQRRGGRNGRRPGGDREASGAPGQQEPTNPPRDQKDQLTWQQKMLLS